MSDDVQSLPIHPRGPIDAQVRAPGSKSITNRALPLAFLTAGPCVLSGGLRSDDTDVMCEALRALGAQVEVDDTTFRVCGPGPDFNPPE